VSAVEFKNQEAGNMAEFDLAALNALPKSGQALKLGAVNGQLENLSAEQRVEWALEHLPGEFVLSSSFGIQAAVCLHLVTRIKPDIPVILTDTGYLFPEPISLSINWSTS